MFSDLSGVGPQEARTGKAEREGEEQAVSLPFAEQEQCAADLDPAAVCSEKEVLVGNVAMQRVAAEQGCGDGTGQVVGEPDYNP